MCYMTTDDRIGVRELRQNLSVYLVRVAAGETLEVTDHGQPVALLSPIRIDQSPLAMLEREGRLVPATGDLLAGSRRLHTKASTSRALQRQRDDRRL